jgi:hypothetical protein
MGKVQVEFHTQIHRPIPEGFLKRAVITRHKKGFNIEWRLSLVIEIDEANDTTKKERRMIGQGMVAIDVGYRMIDGKLRIAVLYGDYGQEEIYLPDKLLRSMEYVKELQQTRDSMFETIKKQLYEVLPADLPQDLKTNWEKARQGRIIQIMDYLKEIEHFFGENLERWRRKDIRLMNEMAGLRHRVQRYRKWFYTNTAYDLCNRYSLIGIERLDLKGMARKENLSGEPNPLIGKARENGRLASVGELLKTIKDVTSKRGCELNQMETPYSTIKCHICGAIVVTKQPKELKWKCDNCGNVWDQDTNAAINLYEVFKASHKTEIPDKILAGSGR